MLTLDGDVWAFAIGLDEDDMLATGDAVASLESPRSLVDSALEWLRGSSGVVDVPRKVEELDTLVEESNFSPSLSPRKPNRLLEWLGGSTPAWKMGGTSASCPESAAEPWTALAWPTMLLLR